MVGTTLAGLEEVLAVELKKMGAKEIQTHTRACFFFG